MSMRRRKKTLSFQSIYHWHAWEPEYAHGRTIQYRKPNWRHAN